MASRSDEDVVMVNGEATQAMPIIGELISLLGESYRCVSIAYADDQETGGVPEVRVRYRHNKHK